MLTAFASARTGLAHAHILEHLVMMIQIDTSSAVLLTPPCLGEKQLRSKTSMLNDSVACPALSAEKCRMGSAEKDDGGQWSFEGVGAFKFKHKLSLPLVSQKSICTGFRGLVIIRFLRYAAPVVLVYQVLCTAELGRETGHSPPCWYLVFATA